MTNQTKDWEELLSKFKELSSKRWQRSFHDVMGVTAKEVICSRLLAFFLDPSEEHPYGGAVLAAFLKSIDLPETDLTDVKIYTEALTENGKRLDLLIESNEWVIGIENKIYAWLYNDLAEYRQFLENRRTKLSEERGLETPPKIRAIVFAPYPVSGKHEKAKMKRTEFSMQSYQSFVSLCENQVSMGKTENRFQYLYEDFMTNLRNLGHHRMDTPEAKYFLQHSSRIEALYSEYSIFWARALEALRSEITEIELFEKAGLSPSVYQKTSLHIGFPDDLKWAVNVNANEGHLRFHIFKMASKTEKILPVELTEPLIQCLPAEYAFERTDSGDCVLGRMPVPFESFADISTATISVLTATVEHLIPVEHR